MHLHPLLQGDSDMDWREVAAIGQSAIVVISVVYIGFTAFFVFTQLALFTVALFAGGLTREGLSSLAWMLFVGWPIMLLFCFLVDTAPRLTQFHRQLLKCIARQPVAPDPSDADQIQWCLEHFRPFHRFLCWIRRRDYIGMIAACEFAKQGEADRRLLPRIERQSPSLVGFCYDFWSTRLGKAQQDVNESLGRGVPPEHPEEIGSENSDPNHPIR